MSRFVWLLLRTISVPRSTVVSLGFSQEVFYAAVEALVLWEGTEGSTEEDMDTGAEPELHVDASQVVATFDAGVPSLVAGRSGCWTDAKGDRLRGVSAVDPSHEAASTVVDTRDALYVAMTDHGVVARVQDGQVTISIRVVHLPRWPTGPNS